MNKRQEIEQDCKHLSLRRSGGTTTKVRCLRNDKGIITLELSYTQGLATDVFNNSKMFERRCSELCRMLCVAIKAARDDGRVPHQESPSKAAAVGAGMVFFNIHKNIQGTLDQPVFGIKVDAHVVREDDVMAQVGFVAHGLLDELNALDCALPYARLVKAARHSRSFIPKPKHRPSNPFT